MIFNRVNLKCQINCLLAGLMVGMGFAARLESDFAFPPDSTRPFVYWYWMNGHISREGIRADLDSYTKAGISGVYLMNVGMTFPKGPIRFNTPEGIDMIKYAIKEAGARGIQVNLYNGAGWSASGGPWITAEYAMQKLTWSETQVTGGKHIDMQLQRPTVLKTYKPEFFEPEKPLDWYRDVAVLAFPTPAAEQHPIAQPVVTASDPAFDPSKLANDDPVPAVQRQLTFAKLTTSKDSPGWIQWTYPQSFTAQSLRLEFQGGTSPAATQVILFCSDNGREWKQAGVFPVRKRMPVNRPFVPASARYWKLEFPVGAENVQIRVISAVLLPVYRIADWTAKAMFDDQGLEKPPLPPTSKTAPKDSRIPLDSIIELTEKLDNQGRLNWDAPAGHWTILRFGHTPTGMCNRPAAHGGAGLECDKFSRDAIDLQWENAIGPYLNDPEVAPYFQYVHIDSWEVYAQNWSKRFPEAFRERMGYDLRRYLPVMTGRVVESLEVSERFLWDIRTAVCSLFDDFFTYNQQLCSRHGKKFTLEPYHQEQFNSTSAGTRADIPMCEKWRSDHNTPAFWTKLGSSPAHVSGKNLVGCEAFTSNLNYSDGGDWSKDFADQKLTAHNILSGGINMMVFHVSAHNPWPDVLPGMTVGSCGQHFEPGNPIWAKASGFTDFIARSQHLLRQGRFVADVLYSCGENSPSKSFVVTGDLYPGQGYDYDICSPEIIIERLSVRDDRLVLPHGMSYRLLVLPETETMSLEMISKIKELVRAGATVLASKPSRAAGLSGGLESDTVLRVRADEIWGDDKDQKNTSRRLGSGRIIWERPVAQVLAEMGIVPDFSAPVKNPRFPFLYIHRQTEAGADIYYVANTDKQKISGDFKFRVAAKLPELWNPVTGEIRRLPQFRTEGSLTVIPMVFDTLESFFVVFKPESSAALKSKQNFPECVPLQQLTGPWKVSFGPQWWEGPESVLFDELTDWSTHPHQAIKYYSGKAVYTKSFDLKKPADVSRLYLDLGEVKNVASITLNSISLGIVWCKPWRVEITDIVKEKDNRLEIEVINLLPNRMIGDEHRACKTDYRRNRNHIIETVPTWLYGSAPRQSSRYTFATFNPYTKDSPLLPSGLLGPVSIRVEKQ